MNTIRTRMILIMVACSGAASLTRAQGTPLAKLVDGVCRLDGREAYNPGRVGECGDLSSIRMPETVARQLPYQNMHLVGLRAMFASLPQVSFHRSHLTSANLREGHFPEADFRESTMSKATLMGANLKAARFEKSDLRHADLSGARLDGADLRGADLRHARLLATQLTGARFGGADLRGADLSESITFGTDFKGAIYDDSTSLPFSRDEAARRGLQRKSDE